MFFGSNLSFRLSHIERRQWRRVLDESFFYSKNCLILDKDRGGGFLSLINLSSLNFSSHSGGGFFIPDVQVEGGNDPDDLEELEDAQSLAKVLGLFTCNDIDVVHVL